MTETRDVRIVNALGTLQSMRRFGVSFEEGLGELVDNAVDAGARNIAIRVAYEEGSLLLVVADDGIGIPESVPGRPDIVDTVQHVLRYGGKIAHGGHPFPIGKFGFGLSQTATCLSQRTTVHSRVQGGLWRSCFIDQADLAEHSGFLPPEQIDDPPVADIFAVHMQDLPHGTVVIMEDIVNSGYKVEEHLINWLERELGRTYRHPLTTSLSITLDTLEGEHAREVILRDPLGRMPESYEVGLYGGPMDLAGEVTLVFDGKDVSRFPPIIDSVTNQPAVVKVEMVNFDIERVYSALGIEASATVNGQPVQSSKGRAKLGEAGFNLSRQGFSVVRNGREIRSGESLGIYTKHHNSNYFRGQVAFPTCLDDLFRVQVVKGRYDLDPILCDVLRERCRATINSIQSSTQTERTKLRARSHDAVTPTAEERSGPLRSLFPREPVPKEQHEKQKAALKHAKQQRIERVESQEAEAVRTAEGTLEAARLMEQPAAIKAAEAVLETARARKEERVREVRNRFSNDAFMRKFVEPVPGGDLYAIRDFHNEIWVVINSDSDFFRTLYERTTQQAERQALLDLMIFAIAHAEATKANTPEMKRFWVKTRRKIARFSRLFVSVFEEDEEAPIDLEAELEKDEAYERSPQTSLDAWGVQ